MNKIVKILDDKLVKLSTNEKIINDFINQKTEQFINMSIKELSNFLFVSIGSITRYVKKWGFRTFKDLKNKVIKEQEKNKKYKDQKNTDFVENINLYYKHALDKTMETLNKNSINKAYLMLEKAKKIFVYGISSSMYVAKEMAHNLSVIGKDGIVAQTIHDIILYLDLKAKNDYLVCIFSKSVHSKENKFILDFLEKYEIPVILISKNQEYKNTQHRVVINFQTLEQDRRIVALSSKISQLFISDVLIRKLYLNNNKQKNLMQLEFEKEWK
ncbi:MurR/RpiR family transcriptional regulator [[Mycoplasma] collis]|uniref:MurR/RpiR family transcriptional regulator n=1 Tax=[Mycoplasma] collis TaxID=2127 RepID=UPI00051B0AC5|nr:MurR/RpiR family transcriptional regulator [[Mycoplasma] collis]